MARIPSKCWVRYVELTPKGAHVTYDCPDEKSGGRGSWTTYGRGGKKTMRNYRSTIIRGVKRVTTGNGIAHTTGRGARIDFQLSPSNAHCARHGDALVCTRRGKKKC